VNSTDTETDKAKKAAIWHKEYGVKQVVAYKTAGIKVGKLKWYLHLFFTFGPSY
jgi:hypothetical protein